MSKEEVTIKQIEDLYFDLGFQKLIKSTERFNMFRVMGIEKKERVHSDIISYLLDPEKNHTLEKSFLKQFLISLKNKEGISFDDYLKSIKESHSVEIETEKYLSSRNIIDIFVEFPSLVIGIENKVKAGEGPDQLKQYQQEMKKKYNYKNKLIVFLTPSGKKPDSSDSEIGVKVISISYEDIKNICEDIKENAHENIKMFLDNFIIHLEEDIMGTSNKIFKLCQEIYENHPEAYQYMVEQHQKIIKNKIQCLFDKLKEDIKQIDEEGLIVGEDDPEIVVKSNDKIIASIKTRNEDWPEGFYIRIYKHSKFGIYPFVETRKLKNELLEDQIEKYFTKAVNVSSSFETNDYKLNESYFTKEYVNTSASYRAIRDKGDEMTKEDVEKAKKRLIEIYQDINQNLIEINEKR